MLNKLGVCQLVSIRNRPFFHLAAVTAGLLPRRTNSTSRRKPLCGLVEHANVNFKDVKSRQMAGLIGKIARAQMETD
jgi:hypothetical protein